MAQQFKAEHPAQDAQQRKADIIIKLYEFNATMMMMMILFSFLGSRRERERERRVWNVVVVWLFAALCNPLGRPKNDTKNSFVCVLFSSTAAAAAALKVVQVYTLFYLSFYSILFFAILLLS